MSASVHEGSAIHFTIVANEAGVITDPNIHEELGVALNAGPAPIDTVFVFAHGWLSDFQSFAASANRFIAGLLALDPPALTGCILALPVNWPSLTTQDSQSPLHCFDALTFFSVEKRADVIGANAVYALLRACTSQSPRPLRFVLIGHSFGCRVVAAALAKLAGAISPAILAAAPMSFSVVLLQAAFESNDLEAGGDYGPMATLPNLSVFATYSSLDKALVDLYPAANVANLFSNNKNRWALGGVGPSTPTVNLYGPRLVALDISPWHQKRPGQAAPLAGHHSDIFIPELFSAVGAFLRAAPHPL